VINYPVKLFQGSRVLELTIINYKNNLFMKKLNVERMKNIQGGVVTQAEYCATLCMIMTHNPVTGPMVEAFNKHCGNYYC
jgi:hypothetical protein